MKFKSLLFGSAGFLLAVGGAHAADLSAAEPVNYVKVCDAFGSGYYYAPGTDTCIKISGYTRFEILLNTYPTKPETYSDASHVANHYFKSKMQLNVYAKSMTEYGPLTGWIQLEANDPLNAGTVGITASVLSLGPLSAGYDWSIFSPAAYTFTPDTNSEVGRNGAVRTNFVGLNWATNGFGFAIAAEDYRARDGALPSAWQSTGSMPDIVANVTGGSGPLKFILAGGVGQRNFGTSWGVNGAVTIGLDALTKGDALLLGAVYSGTDDGWIDATASSPAGPPAGVYSIYGSFLHNWTSMVSTTLVADYRSDTKGTNIVANLKVTPVKNFSVQAELAAAGVNFGANKYTGLIRLQRSFP